MHIHGIVMLIDDITSKAQLCYINQSFNLLPLQYISNKLLNYCQYIICMDDCEPHFVYFEFCGGKTELLNPVTDLRPKKSYKIKILSERFDTYL